MIQILSVQKRLQGKSYHPRNSIQRKRQKGLILPLYINLKLLFIFYKLLKYLNCCQMILLYKIRDNSGTSLINSIDYITSNLSKTYHNSLFSQTFYLQITGIVYYCSLAILFALPIQLIRQILYTSLYYYVNGLHKISQQQSCLEWYTDQILE